MIRELNWPSTVGHRTGTSWASTPFPKWRLTNSEAIERTSSQRVAQSLPMWLANHTLLTIKQPLSRITRALARPVRAGAS
jgi:hypothetical protein